MFTAKIKGFGSLSSILLVSGGLADRLSLLNFLLGLAQPLHCLLQLLLLLGVHLGSLTLLQLLNLLLSLLQLLLGLLQSLGIGLGLSLLDLLHRLACRLNGLLELLLLLLSLLLHNHRPLIRFWRVAEKDPPTVRVRRKKESYAPQSAKEKNLSDSTGYCLTRRRACRAKYAKKRLTSP